MLGVGWWTDVRWKPKSVFRFWYVRPVVPFSLHVLSTLSKHKLHHLHLIQPLKKKFVLFFDSRKWFEDSCSRVVFPRDFLFFFCVRAKTTRRRRLIWGRGHLAANKKSLGNWHFLFTKRLANTARRIRQNGRNGRIRQNGRNGWIRQNDRKRSQRSKE